MISFNNNRLRYQSANPGGPDKIVMVDMEERRRLD